MDRQHRQLLLEQIEHASSKKQSQPTASTSLQLKSNSSISKYNLFVSCYNKSCNRIDQKTLIFVPESKILNSLQFILAKSHFTALLILAFLFPFANLFLIIYLGIATYRYFKGLTIYRKNQKRVKDPFRNMKFDPARCSQFKKNFHFFNLTFKSLNPEFNFKENKGLVQSQGKLGQKTEWMIYNERFSGYYTDFPKWRLKYLTLMLTSVILTMSSIAIFLLFI